ncbi:ABC transporter permease [Salinibacterium soli]|uniref:ABC transporter permease n=1 Tax=Antiquaquibacter soli TaxID=3064523 RepID=A0ABT9BPW6_9MICO|nr:ABC transporter permease [Protaetiibacter sp. WY-16]MDO7883071.1 ABC transporter permease [Protaetiibacter sp. WY-16]
MKAALITETMKFVRARVSIATTIMLTVGIGLLCSSMLLAASGDDPNLAAKLGALVDPGGWAGYLSTASQITAIAGLLGFGVVLSWLYLREFSEGTVTGLFALPVGRGTTALAKLIVYLLWAAVVSAVLVAALVALGFVFGLPSVPDAAALATQLIVSLLTACLALPAAWAATLGRGALAGIATIVGVVVVAQVAAIGGIGAWFPFSSPGLWATGAPV